MNSQGPTLDRPNLGRTINAQYEREHAELGADGTYKLLDDAGQWDLSETLAGGGVVGFAHVAVAACGIHVAAAVNACLDSGADTVLALSVLHAFTDEMEASRQDVAAGGTPSDHATWGIQGPGLDFRQEWRGDHALRSLRHFWAAETKRRGITDRRIVERYPYLAGRAPEAMPNFDEVAKVAENAVIVTTGDQFHHGIGYGTPVEEALEPEPEGLAAAKASMERGIAMIEAADYGGYEQHCVTARSDDRDTAQLYRQLRGPLNGTVVDIAHSDFADVYGHPAPTWAAGGFLSFERVSFE